MNQDNKFGEIKQKLLAYWAVFLTACGKLWDQIKVNAAKAWEWLRRNGKALAQKTAAWLVKAKESLSVWLAAILEKLRPLPGKVKAWWNTTVERLKGGKPADTQEALPAAETSKALPAAPEKSAEAIVPAVQPAAAEEIAPVVQPAAAEAVEPAEKIADPNLRKAVEILTAIGKGIKLVLKWMWKLRTIFMAAPVVWAAVKLAAENMERLPEQVGLDIQATGEFATMISRQEAVYWPLGITAFCLVLMFCSKKHILPWVISIFTLVLPWLIWILNYYA